MVVTMTSEAYGVQPGGTYTGPEEAWLVANGYAKNADGGDAGTVPDDITYAASFTPGVGNDNQTDYTGAIKADGLNHLAAADGGLATGVLPADDPTLAENREDPYWPDDEGDVEHDYDFDAGGVDTDVPNIETVEPATGDIAGGTVVTIKGQNLIRVTGVTFGGVAGTAFDVVDDDEVTVTTPAHAAGAVAVVATNPSGTDTIAAGFTYVDETP